MTKNKIKIINTKEAIVDKQRLIEEYCQGSDCISMHNKSVLENDIKILQNFMKETYVIGEFEENTYLSLKSSVKQIMREWVISEIHNWHDDCEAGHNKECEIFDAIKKGINGDELIRIAQDVDVELFERFISIGGVL